jgi:hypothetical protein
MRGLSGWLDEAPANLDPRTSPHGREGSGSGTRCELQLQFQCHKRASGRGRQQEAMRKRGCRYSARRTPWLGLGRGGGGASSLEWNGGDGGGRAMPVLVHELFVASLASRVVALLGSYAPAEWRGGGGGTRPATRGLIATNPHYPRLPSPLLPAPPPSSTSSLCSSRCSATSTHPQRGSVAVSRRPQEPIVWNVERKPRAQVDGSLNVVMADELCPCPPMSPIIVDH